MGYYRANSEEEFVGDGNLDANYDSYGGCKELLKTKRFLTHQMLLGSCLGLYLLIHSNSLLHMGLCENLETKQKIYTSMQVFPAN